MYIVIMTGALFIIFNLFAAIHTFRNGHKEARLFIVGFGIVFVSYMMIIADALGFTSIMQYFQNILMWGTAVEAFVLSLAFADRYQILKDAKEQSDVRLLHESLKREELVGKEVEKKTDELNKALRNRETLLKEVHHRVKNNLQVILSMIRIQTNSADDEKTKETFMELQNRINTIAKTYMMLVEGEDLEHVDMDEYLSQLFTDIQYSLTDNRLQHISITSSIDLELSLYQAVCVGLILNELITNSYKHAFKGRREGVIEVRLEEKEGYCILHYMDNGKGIDITKPSKSMGGKLIQRLVADQLEGEINVSNESGTEYKIGFYK